MTAAWKVSGLSHTEKLVLLSLSDNANDDGVCWPRIKKMMERCDLSESSVHRSITSLEEVGHIERVLRPGRSTVYKIHPLQSDTPSEKHPGPVTEAPTPPQDDTNPPSQRHPESSSNPQEPPKEPSLLDGVSYVAWGRWLQYRRDIKKPLKPASYDAAQKSLLRFGSSQEAVVEQSIANGYQGLFDLKSTPAKVDAAGKPVLHKFYVTDETSGNLDLIKIAEADLKPWELEKLRALQKKFKSKTIFYLNEIRNND